jgi:hypothetical protein
MTHTPVSSGIASTPTFRKKVVFASVTFGVTLVLAFLVAEATIQVIDRLLRSVKPVESSLDYSSTWREGGMGRGGFLKEGFSGDVLDGYGGTVRWVNNSAGFRSEQDFSERPEAGVLRILSLGDSFVAGYRVAQGKTISDLVELQLEKEGVPCEMLISCVENPHRGLDYLRDHGHEWKPHAVLLGITLGNDIAQDYASLDPEQIGFRHGLENQELPSYCLSRTERPLFERAFSWLRRRSRLLGRVFPETAPIVAWYGANERHKMFDPCHGLGFYIVQSPPIIQEAYRRHCRVLSDYHDFCRERKILFVVLLFPQRFQVQPKDWRATVAHYQLNPDSFDLRLPNKRIGQFCEEARIPVVDPTEHMTDVNRREGLDMYLPRGDMHWSEKGHSQCFKGVWARLRGVLGPGIPTADSLKNPERP